MGHFELVPWETSPRLALCCTRHSNLVRADHKGRFNRRARRRSLGTIVLVRRRQRAHRTCHGERHHQHAHIFLGGQEITTLDSNNQVFGQFRHRKRRPDTSRLGCGNSQSPLGAFGQSKSKFVFSYAARNRFFASSSTDLTLSFSSQKSIRKETCWVASNIAAGTHKQIFALMRQTGVMQKIVDLASSASWEVRKEALWTLSNICTTGDNGHAQTVVQCEGLYPLADVLSVGSADPTVLCACLDAVERILEVGEQVGLDYGRLFDEYQGIDHLEQLQEHPSDAVYKKTIKIIENHFGGEDAEDENLLPATSENGTFGFGISSPKQLFPTDTPVFHFGHVSNRAY